MTPVLATPPTATTHAACRCDDPDAHAVAALMTDYGMGQLEASRVVYGATPLPTASAAEWAAWGRQYVRDLFAPLREVVGL